MAPTTCRRHHNRWCSENFLIDCLGSSLPISVHSVSHEAPATIAADCFHPALPLPAKLVQNNDIAPAGERGSRCMTTSSRCTNKTTYMCCNGFGAEQTDDHDAHVTLYHLKRNNGEAASLNHFAERRRRPGARHRDDARHRRRFGSRRLAGYRHAA